MSKKKEQMGKGLRALLSNIDKIETEPGQKEEVIRELSSTIAKIPLEMIESNPYQPRKEFDQNELLQLVQSIKSVGLIQPVTLRKIGPNRYQIISGERRWRAAKLSGLTEIPAYIRVADDQGMLEMALIENIQRSDLNALEIALSYQRLIEECELQHNELAQHVGKDRSTVTNYIRLLKLPPQIQAAIKSGILSMGHARALLGVDEQDKQLSIYKKIINNKLSVRNTEELIKNYKQPATKPQSSESNKEIHPEVLKIRDRLREKLGSKIEIQRNTAGQGKLIIYFSSDDQFNDIIDLIEE